ncbi:MAG: hypothetical protein J6Y01_10500 [Spirochaetales bacterium]|nr:hypothetical protein [Spirochaetales bacterium]
MKLHHYLLFVLCAVMCIGCSQNSTESETANAVKITVRSNYGVTQNVVNENTRQLMSAKTRNAQTGLLTTRQYSYDKDGNLIMIDIDDQATGSCLVTYSDYEGVPSRSSRSDSVDAKNVKVRRITRTRDSGRGPESSNTYVEYYYDENVNILCITTIDDKNNIYIKGETK